MSTKNISYMPTDGLCYDPNDPKYWDADALAEEVTRVFEVCHGCRMCFKFCDSFPSLFSFIDDRHDGDVTQLTAPETQQVMDECFQCKLCEVQCPYTPRDGHEFELDFPKLVHRYKAQYKRKHGFTLQDKVLRDPDAAGRLARMSFGMANVMNRVKVHRLFMETFLGIHRDKDLPDFASTTFEKWAVSAGRSVSEPDDSYEVVLFQTCFVQNNEPQIGRDTLEVLDANQIPACCTPGLHCCGMPAWEKGDLDTVRTRARANLERLMPFVEGGQKVCVLQPSCSMMLRREYPELVDTADRERAEQLAEAIVDPGELLWSIRKEDRFNTEFKSRPPVEKIAYHAPCHLRAQGVGFRGRDVIRKAMKLKVSTVMECCGHDGTWSMTTEGFEASIRVGKRSFDDMKAAETQLWVTDCSLAAIQFRQHAGVMPIHPMTLLAQGYRENGFSKGGITGKSRPQLEDKGGEG